MTRKRVWIYAGIAFVSLIAISVGGLIYFYNSSDLHDIRTVIASSAVVKERVGENVAVSVSPVGLSYRFSGNWAYAKLTVRARGNKGSGKFAVELEKSENAWLLKRIVET